MLWGRRVTEHVTHLHPSPCKQAEAGSKACRYGQAQLRRTCSFARQRSAVGWRRCIHAVMRPQGDADAVDLKVPCFQVMERLRCKPAPLSALRCRLEKQMHGFTSRHAHLLVYSEPNFKT